MFVRLGWWVRTTKAALISLLRGCGVLLGIFGNLGVLTWCFCGEFVVDCVVNVVSLRSLFRGWKLGQGSRIYFFAGLAAIRNGQQQYAVTPLRCSRSAEFLSFGGVQFALRTNARVRESGRGAPGFMAVSDDLGGRSR